MKILYSFISILLLFVNFINCNDVYKIKSYLDDGVEFELFINISSEITDGWNGELEFDDPTRLEVYETGDLKSQENDKIFHFVNRGNWKTLKAGSTLKIRFIARFKGAGANLIRASFDGKTLDIGPIPTRIKFTIEPIKEGSDYDYKKVLHASLLFYEAQRSGKLPPDNRILWRGDSMLDDKGSNGEDLTGGYYDAGDLVKFGFPMAFTVTALAWSMIQYEDAYKAAGELKNGQNAIKWGTDYFIKAHTKDHEFYGQVGNGGEDHSYWGRPENWPKDKKRPAYKITNHGTDLLGETAAALAAASIVFKSDSSYSSKLLTHAKALYAWANEKRGTYTDDITDASQFYKSWSGYGDELGWSSAWLYRATKDHIYLDDFNKHWNEFNLTKRPLQFGWDDKLAGLQMLMAQITNDTTYKNAVQAYCDWLVHTAPKSPKGMVYLDQWGPLRHASNVAFICLQAADLGINADEYRTFAKKQIGYALGDTGRSFVVGIGVNPPSHPHHRASSCANMPLPCTHQAMQNPGPNPEVLIGALVGGPDQNDKYEDKRDDFVHNEVACDYNAGFQGAVSALIHLHNKQR